MPKIKTTVSLPKLPKIPNAKRNPPGWNSTEARLVSKGLPGAEKFKQPEPAGDPPDWWTGTRPEWAIYWAFLRLKMQPGADFIYQWAIPSSTASGYAYFDFYVPDTGTIIEIQGDFWHYGQGTRKIENDVLRIAAAARHGQTMIHIDERDALRSPLFYLEEALRGIDHSRLAGKVI